MCFTLQEICIQRVEKLLHINIAVSDLSTMISHQIACKIVKRRHNMKMYARSVVKMRKTRHISMQRLFDYEYVNDDVSIESDYGLIGSFIVHKFQPRIIMRTRITMSPTARYFDFLELGAPGDASLKDILSMIEGVSGMKETHEDIEEMTNILTMTCILSDDRMSILRYKFVGNWTHMCYAAEYLQRKIFYSTQDTSRDITTPWGSLTCVRR